MAATFRLQIITQQKTLFDREVVSLVAPGGLGYLGVLAHHAPLLTTLTKGRLRVREQEKPLREFLFDVSGGFLEMQSNTATILADELTIVSEPEGERLDDVEE